MYLNKALIFGNLTRDPELKSLPSGSSVTTFSLATNRVWNDREGKRQESTEYHNIVVFGKQAETTAQYLRKGSSALIEGRIVTRSWDAQDGTKKYRTEIVAERVQFGPRSAGTGAGPARDAGSAPAKQESPKEEGPAIQYPDAESEGINPEDIPF
ncbi:MAG: single-stranded DNA-binding protein [Patescibacteria group bacterium]